MSAIRNRLHYDMVLETFIEEIEKKSVEQHLCNSTDLTAGLSVSLTLLSVLNSFFSVTAFSWKCSDPNCSSQGVLASSAVKTLAS